MGFFGSSVLATFLFGVAVGNAINGMPLNERGIFVGSSLGLLMPYPLLVGVLAVTMFAMHGALYLYLKVPKGDLHQKMGRWVWHAWGVFLVVYILTTIYTFMVVPNAVVHFRQWPLAFLPVVINVLAVANIPRTVFADRPGQAFISSCVTIIALVSLFSIALWPNLVTASNDPGLSLSIYNAASSVKTLGIMFIIALIGMPLVLTYTVAVYWTFRRRVEIGEHSY
jgi:cytochrome d ubiquinol oxidase subunit II